MNTEIKVHYNAKVFWLFKIYIIAWWTQTTKAVSIPHCVVYHAQLFVWRSWFQCVGKKTILLSYIFKLNICYWKFKYRYHVFFKCVTLKWNVSCSNSAFYTCIWYYVLFKIWRKKMFIGNFIKIWNHYLQKCLMLDIFNRYAMP